MRSESFRRNAKALDCFYMRGGVSVRVGVRALRASGSGGLLTSLAAFVQDAQRRLPPSGIQLETERL